MASAQWRRPLVPDEQRRRVRKACDRCRRNKLKCDGAQPCQRCRVGSRNCLFTFRHSSVSQHGSGPSAIAPSEREKALESILRRAGIGVPTDLDALKQQEQNLVTVGNTGMTPRSGDSLNNDPGRDDSGEPAVVPSVTPGADADSVIVNHVPRSQTYVHDQEGKTYFEGVFSSWAFYDAVQQSASHDDATQSSSNASSRQRSSFRHSIIDSPNGLLTDLRPSLLAALPPREALRFLSDSFFMYAESNFCTIHPAIFSNKLDAFLEGTSEFGPSMTSLRRPIEFVCVLFIILALGTQFAGLEQDSYDSTMDRSTVLSPSTGLLLPQRVVSPQPNPGWKFYEISRRLLSDVVTSSSMTSVQACTLHGGYLVGTSAHDAAYNMHGLGLRMAINMGMHKLVNSDMLHPHVRELRNRLWWGVFTRDRLFSFQMGRPISIEDDEIDTPIPAHVSELAVEKFKSSVDNQIALIKLGKLLGKIIKTIYPSFGSPGSDSTRVINTSQFLALQRELRHWKSELPEVLKLSPSASRGVYHVHLTYEQAIVLLNRLPMIHTAATIDNSTPDEQQEKILFFRNAVKGCVGAAMATIKILKLLRESKLLCQYTCQDSLYCSSALHVLLLGAKLEPPNEDMKGIIADGILLLKELARGNETASSTLQGIITGFNRHFEKQVAVSRPATPSADEPDSTKENRAFGHRAWQDWMHGDPSLPSRLPPNHQAGGDPFNAYIQSAIDSSSIVSYGGPGNVPGDGLLPPTAASDTTSPSLFMEAGENSTASHPQWFLELDKSFSLLDGDLAQNMTMGGLYNWDYMPTDFYEVGSL